MSDMQRPKRGHCSPYEPMPYVPDPPPRPAGPREGTPGWLGGGAGFVSLAHPGAAWGPAALQGKGRPRRAWGAETRPDAIPSGANIGPLSGAPVIRDRKFPAVRDPDGLDPSSKRACGPRDVRDPRDAATDVATRRDTPLAAGGPSSGPGAGGDPRSR